MSKSRAASFLSVSNNEVRVKGKIVIALKKVHSHVQLLIYYWVFNKEVRVMLSAHIF